jgi:hypothetical protein
VEWLPPHLARVTIVIASVLHGTAALAVCRASSFVLQQYSVWASECAQVPAIKLSGFKSCLFLPLLPKVLCIIFTTGVMPEYVCYTSPCMLLFISSGMQMVTAVAMSSLYVLTCLVTRMHIIAALDAHNNDDIVCVQYHLAVKPGRTFFRLMLQCRAQRYVWVPCTYCHSQGHGMTGDTPCCVR